MSEDVQVAILAALSAAGVVLLAVDLRARSEAWRRRARQALLALAALAVAAHVNFGAFHGGGLFVHHWEQFHYFLGAKYFPELGYDGLYVASMGAEMVAFPGLPHQPFLRDLRSNEIVPTATLDAHGLEVRRRFSDRRWAAFVQDNAYYLGLDPAYLRQVRSDHGYNPSPAWTFVARLFSASRVATKGTARLLAALDVLLLAGAFVLLFRTYGRDVGALALLVWATGYGWRFYWTGGAFLRQDWLAAVLVGLCLLRRGRHGLAGAALAYAAMVRVFPVLLLGGLAARAARDLARGEDTRWARRLGLGFALAAALLLAAGSASGRGPGAWLEFARNLRKHDAAWLNNNVGLKLALLYGPETYGRRLVAWGEPEPWARWQRHMERLERERLWLWGGGAALLVALALWRSRGERQDLAAALGVSLVFALVSVTCYYWSVLAATVARRPRATALALLLVNLGVCAAHFASPAHEVRYGAMSWGLLIFFVGWLLAGGGRAEAAASDAAPAGGAATRGAPARLRGRRG
jgi:hypothetical protein